MTTDAPYAALLDLYDRSLDDFRRHLRAVADEGLPAPTPCAGWDVGDLLGHVIEENLRFARAVDPTSSTPETEAVVGSTGEIRDRWERSVATLRSAFGSAAPEASVRLDGFPPLSVEVALRMQLLDTVVHAWDLARSLGHDHRPDDALVDLVAGFAGFIAERSPEGTPGVFAAPVPSGTVEDSWVRALADLGRTATAPHDLPR